MHLLYKHPRRLLHSLKNKLGYVLDSSSLHRVKEGKIVSRVVSGDASLFSAVREQMELLEKQGIECEVVPGVSSVFASSAILKAELTLPGVASGVAILRAKGKTLERDYIEEVAKTDLTLAVLLSADKIEEIARRVAEHRGKDTPAAVVYRATQPEEKVIEGTLRDIAEKVKKAGIKRTAVILIGEALKPEKYERSKLYGCCMVNFQCLTATPESSKMFLASKKAFFTCLLE